MKNYFVSDVKKLYNTWMVITVTTIMACVVVADPLLVRVNARSQAFANSVGVHPFQFWLLMNSSGWGYTVYRRLFLVFPVLLTGLVYIKEYM